MRSSCEIAVSRRRQSARHVVALLLSAAVSAALLVFLFVRGRVTWPDVAEAWRGADKTLLIAVAAGSVLFHVFLGADKFRRVFRGLGVELTLGEALRLRLASGTLRLVVPLKAGEIVNVLFMQRRKNVPFSRASGAVGFDRSLNMVGASFWLLVGALLWQDTDTWSRALLLAGAGGAYVLFVFLSPLHRLLRWIAGAVHQKLGRFVEGMLSPFRELSPRQRLFFLGYGVLFQVRPLVVCFLLFGAFGVRPDPGTFVLLASMMIFAGHFPSFLGLGPREAAVVSLFSGLASPATLLGVGLLQTATVHMIPMLVGAAWVPWFMAQLVAGKDT